MPPRVLSILCVLQFLVIGAAYLACSWGLKTVERLNEGNWYMRTSWYEIVWLVKSFILLWLLIPVAQAWVCARLSNSHRDVPWFGPNGSWLVIALTVLVAWLFGAAFVAGLLPPEPRRPVRLIGF